MLFNNIPQALPESQQSFAGQPQLSIQAQKDIVKLVSESAAIHAKLVAVHNELWLYEKKHGYTKCNIKFYIETS